MLHYSYLPKTMEEIMSDMLYVYIDNEQKAVSINELTNYINMGKVNSATLAWKNGMSDWQPLSTLHPELFSNTPTTTPPSPKTNSNTTPASYEIIKKGYLNMPKITINNSEVTLESGVMHYMRGNIEIDAKMPSLGGFFKSKLTGENVVRPKYRGTGEIYLEPTFFDVNFLNLNGEEWILDKGSYLASDADVEVGMYTNKAVAGFFSGEGFFQTSVKGTGKVVFLSQGPLEKLELKGETLTVDGSFAVARTASVQFEVAKATKKMFSSWISGEGIVNKFSGYGTVYIAPVPNNFVVLMQQFGGLYSAISNISTSG